MKSSADGYDKIKFCAAQAKIDRLQSIWIDTCCIHKPDSVELSEAIISLCRWYPLFFCTSVFGD
ncbi:hypothetical protein BX600DRAFT_473184 [Xylariales sp. PMI_506]|nr:hypothetical protein BX600DRAFT_473184 [Xylariales sp. PMI_506]